MTGIRYDWKTQNPWKVIFQIQGSVWSQVLPYCILNGALCYLVHFLQKHGIHIPFSVQGHALMTLIISYLIVSKVNIAFDRYMQARMAIGHALSNLRDLNQFAIAITERDDTDVARNWRLGMKTRIVDLIDCTIRVLKDEDLALFLADNTNTGDSSSTFPNDNNDPMLNVQNLRSHMYHGSTLLPKADLQLLERTKMIDLLQGYVVAYRHLLIFASTPLPFPMIQMGRTFLFLWTFSFPLVLVGLLDQLFSVIQFVFFLTYGFLGLEVVAMKLVDPFGDHADDLNIVGMRDATVMGMEKDLDILDMRWGVVPMKSEKLSSLSVTTNKSSKGMMMHDRYEPPIPIVAPSRSGQQQQQGDGNGGIQSTHSQDTAAGGGNNDNSASIGSFI